MPSAQASALRVPRAIPLEITVIMAGPGIAEARKSASA